MKTRRLALLLFASAILTLRSQEKTPAESPLPSANATDDHQKVAQVIVYCCGNHGPAHCVTRDKMLEYQKKYHCTMWKAQGLHDDT